MARYAAWAEIAGTVLARLLVWGTITILACVLIAWSNSLLDRAIKRLGVTLPHATILASILLLGLASAAGFVIAVDGWLQRQARSFLTTCAAAGLPVLDVMTLALLGLYLLGMPIPPWAFLALAAALVIGVHFFDQDARALRWQKLVQGVAGLAILGSTTAVGWELRAHILAHGWTDMRIYAAVAAGLFALYGLVYLIESLSAPRDAPASRLMDRACPVLALLVAAVCLMLSTPLLDPLALAVKSQARRLESAKDPARFDFTWLNQQGGRFGHEALAAYEHRDSVLITPAFSKAPTAPPRPVPAAAAIGANITFHSEGVLPATLLAQDWSGADVAPCLTKASSVCDAWFLDLDGDGEQEILLAYGDDNHFRANVLKPQRGRWILAATLDSLALPGTAAAHARNRGLPGCGAARPAGATCAGKRACAATRTAPPPCRPARASEALYAPRACWGGDPAHASTKASRAFIGPAHVHSGPHRDYGSGTNSAAKALARVANGKFEIVTTADPEVVMDAERIVLPGVGAFADCMRGLSAVPGMVEALREKVLKDGAPFLGICAYRYAAVGHGGRGVRPSRRSGLDRRRGRQDHPFRSCAEDSAYGLE